MSISDEDISFVKDLFSELGPITTRKMFGGLAIYCDGTIFALLLSTGGAPMIKARDELAQRMQSEGSVQFTYDGKSGKPAAMPYWSLPDDALDDPELACMWARLSLKQNQT